jgi:hypothetical protein
VIADLAGAAHIPRSSSTVAAAPQLADDLFAALRRIVMSPSGGFVE